MGKTVFFILIFLCLPFCLFAQIFSTPPALVPYLQTAPEIHSHSAVLIDAHTGALLYSKNPGDEIPPASLTKLMTMHLVMKEIKEGRASYDEVVPITVESWAQSQPPRSRLMFLEPGQIVTLREILLGLAVVSGNDAAVAAALRISPDMKQFAAKMTMEARSMDLYITRFAEASGISEYNKTTAEEFASFCRQYLLMHPHSLSEFHSVGEFAYPLAANVQERHKNYPRTIVQHNRNDLLRSFPGVDGLKTGFIYESGFNIALTAQRDDTRFILVLLGAPNVRQGARLRAQDGINLLGWAFELFKTVRPPAVLIEQSYPKTVKLWKGRENTAEITLSKSADFTAPATRAKSLFYKAIMPNPLIAPLKAGSHAGFLVISDEIGELSRIPLVTANDYENAKTLKRIWHSVILMFKKR